MTRPADDGCERSLGSSAQITVESRTTDTAGQQKQDALLPADRSPPTDFSHLGQPVVGTPRARRCSRWPTTPPAMPYESPVGRFPPVFVLSRVRPAAAATVRTWPDSDVELGVRNRTSRHRPRGVCSRAEASSRTPVSASDSHGRARYLPHKKGPLGQGLILVRAGSRRGHECCEGTWRQLWMLRELLAT